MAKYIDAEKLKAEIKRYKNKADNRLKIKGRTFSEEQKDLAIQNLCGNLLYFIDSFQQEEQKNLTNKNCNDCPHCIERKDQIGWHFRGCFGGQYKGKPIAEIEVCPLQQEQQKNICPRCIHHGKDDDYCYNPHGGMQRLINENGVYECTGFCETEQEQPEVDLEKEIVDYWTATEWCQIIKLSKFKVIARYFYGLGLARKEESK